MSAFQDLLGVDFDGNPVDDVEDLILEGLDDERHRDRVPGLTALLADEGADPSERLYACIALTTWAEPAGFDAVLAAAAHPEQAPWSGVAVDRLFSVDSGFGPLAEAVRAAQTLAGPRGSEGQRVAALVALVAIADRCYFDGQLTFAVRSVSEQVFADELAPRIAAVVRRGAHRLADGERPGFDLWSQLLALLPGLARRDDDLAAHLAMMVLASEPGSRALRYAVDVVEAGTGEATAQLGDYLSMVGDDAVRDAVAAARGRRNA